MSQQITTYETILSHKCVNHGQQKKRHCIMSTAHDRLKSNGVLETRDHPISPILVFTSLLLDYRNTTTQKFEAFSLLPPKKNSLTPLALRPLACSHGLDRKKNWKRRERYSCQKIVSCVVSNIVLTNMGGVVGLFHRDRQANKKIGLVVESVLPPSSGFYSVRLLIAMMQFVHLAWLHSHGVPALCE